MYIGLTIFNRYEAAEFTLNIEYIQITTFETIYRLQVLLSVFRYSFSGDMIYQKIL